MNSYGLHQLDIKLLNWISRIHNSTNFYIEAGANDGVTQSNTAILEYNFGWTGVLVEPSKINYDKCVKNRPNSHSFNCALVSDSYQEKTVRGTFSETATRHHNGLMSGIEPRHLTSFGDDFYEDVEARTLTSILDSVNAPKSITLCSLDTEGNERDILNGLDFNKYRPNLIMIEIADWNNLDVIADWERYMENLNYVRDISFDQMKFHDFLFIDKRIIA